MTLYEFSVKCFSLIKVLFTLLPKGSAAYPYVEDTFTETLSMFLFEAFLGGNITC